MLVLVNENCPMNAQVFARKDESIDGLLKRFKRAVRNSNVLEEVKERLRYEKPSVKRHRNKIRRKIITSRLNKSSQEG